MKRICLFAVFCLLHTVALADEPEYRREPSLTAANDYLRGRAEAWLVWKPAQKERGTTCMSCHTTIPYLLSHALARGERAEDRAAKSLLESVQQRVALREELPTYEPSVAPQSRGTEAVLNALVLANDDVVHGRKQLSDHTRKALAQLWNEQLKAGERKGAWEWFEFGIAPWEARGEYFGAAMAAAAVGMAPGYLGKLPEGDARHLEELRRYLRGKFATQNLHQQLAAVWATSRLPELLPADDVDKAIKASLSKQGADGGWSSGSLGEWKRGDGSAQSMSSDGYGTAVVVASLQGVVAKDHAGALERGREWLRRHQRADNGSWTAESLNTDYPADSQERLFMRDAATGWAVLALQGR